MQVNNSVTDHDYLAVCEQTQGAMAAFTTKFGSDAQATIDALIQHMLDRGIALNTIVDALNDGAACCGSKHRLTFKQKALNGHFAEVA